MATADRPTYDELIERLAALEERVASPSIDDLPMRDVQSFLEQRWKPDASVLLQSGSVGNEALSMRIDAGLVPVVWDGVTNSVTGTETHRLGRVPLAVVIFSAGPLHFLNGLAHNYTDGGFDWQVSNPGAAPPAGHTDDFVWIAVG